MPRRPQSSGIEPQLLAIAQRMTAEVAALVQRHISDVIRRAIDVGRTSLPRPTPTAKPTVGRRRRRRRVSGDAKTLQAKLLATLSASKKGASLADVIKRTGADRGAVKYHLRALRAQKKAKVVGTRRTARWLAA